MKSAMRPLKSAMAIRRSALTLTPLAIGSLSLFVLFLINLGPFFRGLPLALWISIFLFANIGLTSITFFRPKIPTVSAFWFFFAFVLAANVFLLILFQNWSAVIQKTSRIAVWERFVSPDGAFEIDLPNKPHESRRLGGEFHRFVTNADDSSIEIYDFRFENNQVESDEIYQWLRPRVGIRPTDIRSWRDGKLKSMPYREYLARADDIGRSYIVRIYLIEQKRAIVVDVSGNSINEIRSRWSHLFESLTVKPRLSEK